MTEELEIIAISPDTVFISGKAMTEQDVFDAIDKVIDDLNDTNSLANVDIAIDTLLGLQRVSGKALAKLFYESKYWWVNHNAGENFEDYMESRHGIKSVTIDRYMTVWINIVDGLIPPDVAVRPMRELIPIAKTLSHGHTINRRQWDKIVKATGLNEIGEILRGIKGKAPRKSSLRIEWNRKGDLIAWKENKRVFIGFLDKEAYETNEIARQAIDRLLDSAGVAKK